MSSRMTGAKQFRAALKAAPDDLQIEVAGAIRETVDSVHARGKANIAAMVTSRSGALAHNYRKSVSRATLSGRVGYLSPAARDAAFYARFINDGTFNMEARPFHTNAVEAEQAADEARMVKARDRILGTLAGGGVGGASSRTESL